jgi:hypothetical protein
LTEEVHVQRNSPSRTWETDLAARQVRTPEEAAARARRGAALVRAALAGAPLPAPVDQEGDR